MVKIEKIQKLKNTSSEIVDISYDSGKLTDDPGYNNDKRELWAVLKNSEEFTKIHLNDDSASITNWPLSKKLHEHD